MSRGRVVGLIVRVSYQREDIPANSAKSLATALLAFDVRDSTRPTLLGTPQDNVEARKLVDQAFGH